MSRYHSRFDECGSECTDDSDDPDYRESSADDSADDLPPSMARDRAQWVVDNREAVAELYRAFKESGQALFGAAFFQCGSITEFSHLVYKYTMPGATDN